MDNPTEQKRHFCIGKRRVCTTRKEDGNGGRIEDVFVRRGKRRDFGLP